MCAGVCLGGDETWPTYLSGVTVTTITCSPDCNYFYMIDIVSIQLYNVRPSSSSVVYSEYSMSIYWHGLVSKPVNVSSSSSTLLNYVQLFLNEGSWNDDLTHVRLWIISKLFHKNKDRSKTLRRLDPQGHTNITMVTTTTNDPGADHKQQTINHKNHNFLQNQIFFFFFGWISKIKLPVTVESCRRRTELRGCNVLYCIEKKT